jgi:uncharacterized DUF497 family protein
MFSWDSVKAAANLEKHGISFEEAATIFSDAEGLDWEDLEHSTRETRYKRLGRSIGRRILIVVYTVRRLKDGKETIRIISARHASRKERQAYSGQSD